MTKDELISQNELLQNRINVLTKDNTRLAAHNKIMQNVVQAMLMSIHGQQIDVLDLQYNQSNYNKGVLDFLAKTEQK